MMCRRRRSVHGRPDVACAGERMMACHGQRLRAATVPARQLLYIVGAGRTQGLDQHVRAAAPLRPACPMALFEFGHGRLGPTHPTAQAALGARCVQIGPHAVGQACIVGPREGARLGRAAARLLDRTGTAGFRGRAVDDGTRDVRRVRGALPRQGMALRTGETIGAGVIDELLAGGRRAAGPRPDAAGCWRGCQRPPASDRSRASHTWHPL